MGLYFFAIVIAIEKQNEIHSYIVDFGFCSRECSAIFDRNVSTIQSLYNPNKSFHLYDSLFFPILESIQ